MKRLPLRFVRHSWPAAGLLLLVTVALGAQPPPIRIGESAEALVEKDPSRQYYEKAKQRFGRDNLTGVLLKADDVFTADVLRSVYAEAGALPSRPRMFLGLSRAALRHFRKPSPSSSGGGHGGATRT